MTVNAGVDVEKEKSFSVAGGSANCTVTLEIKMAFSLENRKQSTLRSSNSIHAHPQRMHIHTTRTSVQLCSQKHYLLQLESGSNLDAPQSKNRYRKYGSYTQWGTNQQKNNEILSFTGQWMELEETILNVVTQPQKDKHGMSSLKYG